MRSSAAQRIDISITDGIRQAKPFNRAPHGRLPLRNQLSVETKKRSLPAASVEHSAFCLFPENKQNSKRQPRIHPCHHKQINLLSTNASAEFIASRLWSMISSTAL